MSESEVIEQKLTRFGRCFALLFNRATIYEADHPFFVKSIDEFQLVIQDLVESISPLVFIMNQEQFFVDEEPLDPRLNTSRMLAYFKNTEIQSISFYKGIDRKEIKILADVFTSVRKYPDYQAIQKDFHRQGIKHLRINHVFFKKVAKDEEVISRHTLSELSPHITDDPQLNSKKQFLEMVLESVLAEELEKTLTIKNLVNNPVGLSKNMVNADFAEFRKSDAEDARPGLLLIHQLQIIDEKVDENLSGKGEANLSELAQAVLDMKRQLSEDIETQKALGITYSNEEMILDKANEVTDKVIIRLVKDEYKSGKTSISRLAQILRRLVPEGDELKRLLPMIKTALLEEGMPLSEYLTLTQELARELQGEEISKVLHKIADTTGIMLLKAHNSKIPLN